jgi:hypothetical protein
VPRPAADRRCSWLGAGCLDPLRGAYRLGAAADRMPPRHPPSIELGRLRQPRRPLSVRSEASSWDSAVPHRSGSVHLGGAARHPPIAGCISESHRYL